MQCLIGRYVTIVVVLITSSPDDFETLLFSALTLLWRIIYSWSDYSSDADSLTHQPHMKQK